MKNCCVIGHRRVDNLERISERLERVYVDLVETHGVTRFLFGSNGQFNDLAFDILERIRENMAYNIVIVNYLRRGEISWTHDDEGLFCRPYNRKKITRLYDEIVEDENVIEVGMRRSYVVRNQKMIDDSDICLFYYDPNYEVSAGGNSGTRMAYEYAVSQNKKIILI